jgi:hypothetical protein
MRPTRRTSSVVSFALVSLASTTLVAWLFLVAIHIGDRYRVGHGQGVWMALARYANQGQLYPPIYDGEHFGGTRYMPLQILVNAAGGRITGEYLTSGKLIAFLATGGLLVLVFLLLRRARCPLPLAAALTMLVVVTEAGIHVSTTLGGDVLPALLQVGVLALVAREPASPRSELVAAVLAAVALITKITAVWAVFAVLSWFLATGRTREAARFAVAFAVVSAALLGLAEILSSGRMSENLLSLLLSGGVGIKALGRAPNQLILNLGELAVAAWVLVPFAVLAVVVSRSLREFTVYQWALGWSFLVLLIALSDIGTGYNQLIDVVVLLVLVAGVFAARLITGEGPSPVLSLLLSLTVVWGLGTGSVLTLLPDVKEAVGDLRAGGTEERYPPHPLARVVHRGQTMLSEDPAIPIGLGRTPVIMDPFMLPRLAREKPEAIDDLVARLDRREFDFVVLIESAKDNQVWWTDYHLGLEVIDAVRRNYVLDSQVDGYFLYTPRP